MGHGEGWWGRRPQRPRWVYVLLIAGILGASLMALEVVPVPHTAEANYAILVSQPANASAVSCQGAVFDQSGSYDFAWTPPTGTPLTLTVQDSGGGGYLYNGTTHGQARGSIHVEGSATFYVFCLSVVSGSGVDPGPPPVVLISGALSYEYEAPTL